MYRAGTPSDGAISPSGPFMPSRRLKRGRPANFRMYAFGDVRNSSRGAGERGWLGQWGSDECAQAEGQAANAMISRCVYTNDDLLSFVSIGGGLHISYDF